MLIYYYIYDIFILINNDLYICFSANGADAERVSEGPEFYQYRDPDTPTPVCVDEHQAEEQTGRARGAEPVRRRDGRTRDHDQVRIG